MAFYDNSYSRYVAALKILLPLIALALLSTIFLFARAVDPSQSIPYTNITVGELAQKQRIQTPNYAGVTEGGSAISITADSAMPEPSDSNIVTALGLTGTIQSASGVTIEIRAHEGTIRNAEQHATFNGAVNIETSSGFSMQTETLHSLLDKSQLYSDADVHVDGPYGVIDAGKMSLYVDPSDQNNGAHVLVFNNGVKLIHTPEQ